MIFVIEAGIIRTVITLKEHSTLAADETFIIIIIVYFILSIKENKA